MNLQELIEEKLLTVEKPGQYTNKEWNCTYKNFEEQDLRFILAFPDLYEIGMSNLGQKILYHILNNLEGVSAERVYAPSDDMENVLRNDKIPLFSLESKNPLKNFDVIGFTLQNETCYTNILNMLNLAQIPFLSQERDSSYPLIIAGGPTVYNPEPMADFFDAFVIGDGEEAIVEIAEISKNWKSKFKNKEEFLKELSKIGGVYIPGFYEPTYNQDGSFNSIKTKVDFAPKEIVKRTFLILDKKFYPNKFIVPYISIVHDRAIVEISRGCSRGCRFCQAGITYRPVRTRSKEDIVFLANELISSSGYEEISLASLCAGDFPCLENLVKELIENLKNKKISVSLPSQRLDNFSIETAKTIQSVRKTGLTFAPEAGSQRLRNVINKGITDEDLFRTIEGVFKNGWRSIKLYFMIGLPTETMDDIDQIKELVKKVNSIGKHIGGNKININVTISAFVPKAHTPFQWEGQDEMDVLREKIRTLYKAFSKNIKFQPVEMSFAEAFLSRGDRRLGKVIKRAWEKGAKFDSWDNYFKFNIWTEAFKEENLDMKYFANHKIDINSNLPWGHIKTGVSTEYLKNEYLKALHAESSDNCQTSSCQMCGMEKICQVAETKKENVQVVKNIFKTDNKAPVKKIILRIKYSKLGALRYISHINLNRMWSRAFRRANILTAYSQGFNPQMKISFGTILPVGTTSITEFLEMELESFIEINKIKEQLKNSLPKEVEILEAYFVESEKTSLVQQIFRASYVIQIPKNIFSNNPNFNDIINQFLQKDEIIIVKDRKNIKTSVNIKGRIISIKVLPFEKNDSYILFEFILSLSQEESIRAEDVLVAMFNFNKIELAKIKIERKEVFFK